MLDLRQLRFFVAVADGLNMSRAADRLNISQSALSRQIQDLERQLGVTLFERIGKRLMLTGEGEHILPKVCHLLEQAEAVTALGRTMATGQVGFLRIGATPQTIAFLVSRALVPFRSRHPGVEVTLLEGDNLALIELVRKGAVHLSIAAPSDGHDLSCRPLFDARLMAVFPRHDPRCRAKSLSIEQIADDPLLVLRRGFMTRELLDRSCAAAGIRPRIFLESDSPHTLIALAEEGHGIAVLSTSASSGLKGERGVPLMLDDKLIHQTVSAIWNPKRYQPAGFSYLLQVLSQEATKRMLASEQLPRLPQS